MNDVRIARWSARAGFPAVMALGFGLLVAPSASAAVPQSVTFPYTGQTQTWTVPDGVTTVQAVVDGAAGGDGASSLNYSGGYGMGGAGAQVTTTILVTPGEVLTVFVGQGGSQGQLLTSGGGGAGGTGVEPGGYGGTPDDFFAGGGGGGGSASAIFSGTTILAVAGGGGGGGGHADIQGGTGGRGGSAGNGADGAGPGYGTGGGAGAASTTSGENGGPGDRLSYSAGGGGGGGGWPHGGAGGRGGTYGVGGGGGGGAGASGVDPDRTVQTAMGVSPLTASVAADGRVTLTYQPPGPPTVTTVTVSPAAPVYGQLVTLTIQVTSGGQPVHTKAGTVEVADSNPTFDFSGDLPSRPEFCFPDGDFRGWLDTQGTVTCALADPPAGGHDWFARFTDLDGTYATSTGHVVVHVDQAPTTTTLTSSSSSAVPGQPFTLTATVARALSAGEGLTTDSVGTVTFRDGTTVLCQNAASRSIPSSVFDCRLPAGLPGGAHHLTATWTPDAAHAGFNPSTGSLEEDVDPVAAQLAVQSSAPDGSDFGAPVTFTATVTPASPSGLTPTGTLQFVVDGTPSGGSVWLTAGSGTSAPIAGLTPGTHTVTVDYAGDGSFLPSVSAAFEQQVNKGAASVTVTSSVPAGSALGAPVSFTAVVAPVAPASVQATGSVQFAVDGTPYGAPVPLTGGTANSAATAVLAPGAHTVTAAYTGDGDYTPAVSAALTQQVDAGAQAVTTAQLRALTVTVPTVVANTSVTGPLTVSPGASIALTGATINGPVWINGASAVRICGSTIRGPVVITGTTGPVLIGADGSPLSGCAGNTFWGPVVIVGSSGGTVFDGNQVHGTVTIADSAVGTEIGGNTITDLLACRGNAPAPVNAGGPNAVRGARLGQCSVRGF